MFNTTITKEIVLTNSDGKLVKRTMTYDLYLRPECDNVLIVPNSRKVIEELLDA